MVRQGMAETRKRVWYLSGRCTPTFFFPFLRTSRFQGCSSGGDLYGRVLTYLTRLGYPSLAHLSPRVGLYVTRMTVSQP